MKCYSCNSKKIVKNGLRKNKCADLQKYLCKNCGKNFTIDNTKHKNKTYEPKIIYNAINLYNLGNSLRDTSKTLNKKFKIKTNKSTIHNWTLEYNKLSPISSFREDLIKNKGNIIFKKRFEHENLDYEYMLHLYKLEIFVKNKYPRLYSFLNGLTKGCPNVFFEVGQRCSKPTSKIKVEVIGKNNYACWAADFSVKAAKQAFMRHKFVEEFLIINDKYTVACEIPVWYWDKKIDKGITGHIDLIQVRGDLVYILDYKPDAKKDKKAASQLYQYALGLSYRTGVSLKHMVCAWFDEMCYFEFNPNNIQPKYIHLK